VGDGDPVLFVHGASNSGTSWVDLIAALEGFRCIALDRPGCGLSEPIATGPLRDINAIEAYADALVRDVLDALDLPSAQLVATSYGGYFAFRGAAAYPDRISRVVEFSWPMGAPMDKAGLFLRAGAIPGIRALSTRIPATRRTVRVMLRHIGLARAIETGKFNDDMIDWFVSVLRDTDTMQNELRSSPKVITPMRGLNPRMLLGSELLSRVTMPVLFLWGDEDPNGGEAVARSFAAGFPCAHLEVIPRAGHAPWIDELDLCAARTQGFLAS
jgi:2-hydroxy-6-oxonona-2,4-dienedioate hydrolase/4,5:9,10-diseco-3-hydroxy-5,9,17-trioxoandrosta-1(10),2-diene-4-oate hydrolase